MHFKFNKATFFYLVSIFLFLISCAPGPPPPPIFPGFEWFLIAALIFVVVFLFKTVSTKKPLETNYITDALNAINRHLNELEKKIDELEKKQGNEKK